IVRPSARVSVALFPPGGMSFICATRLSDRPSTALSSHTYHAAATVINSTAAYCDHRNHRFLSVVRSCACISLSLSSPCASFAAYRLNHACKRACSSGVHFPRRYRSNNCLILSRSCIIIYNWLQRFSSLLITILSGNTKVIVGLIFLEKKQYNGYQPLKFAPKNAHSMVFVLFYRTFANGHAFGDFLIGKMIVPRKLVHFPHFRW